MIRVEAMAYRYSELEHSPYPSLVNAGMRPTAGPSPERTLTL